jgi:hypothetical protein
MLKEVESDNYLAHFNHQPTATAYNGIKPTVEQLIQDFGNVDKTKSLPTLNRESPWPSL